MARIAGRTRHGQHEKRDRAASAQSVIGLLALIGAATALGALLWRLGGPPNLPSELPDWQRLRDALSGSTPADEEIVAIVTGIGWAALTYLCVTIVVRVLCESASRVTHGASWAKTALRLSDLVTLPPVQRMVSGAVGGVLLVGVWFRAGPSVAGAAPIVVTVMATEPRDHAGAEQPPVSESANGDLKASPSNNQAVAYTVVEGDTLWNIARRFYGDGSLYASIFEANAGRIMTTGEAFTNPGVIRPSWVLEVPMPAQDIQANGGHVMYTVRHGDSLWRIAESFLGVGLRWAEIWELNKGRDMGGGHAFTDPGNIYPGRVLELPAAALSSDTEPAGTPAEPASPTPTPEPTRAAATASPAEQPAATAPSSPAPFPLPEVPSGDGGAIEWPSPPPGGTVLAAAAGVGGIGGLALIVRRLRRQNGGLSGAALRSRHSTGDAGKVDLAARSLLQALGDLGFDDVRPLLVRESERFLEFTVDCAPGDADALMRSRFDAGRRLACAVDAEGVSRTRVHLKLSRFQRLAGMLLDQSTAAPSPLLVPVGASQNGIYYLNVAAAGSVLVTGDQTETSQMTSSWMSSLGTLHQPERLAFERAGPGDPDARTVLQLAKELEEAIVSREAAAAADSRQTLLSFATLGDQPAEDLTRLDTVVHRGPEHGIFIVCVANRPLEVSNMFGARLAFHDREGEPGGLTLTIGRDTSIDLMPVTVRAQPMTRHADGVGWVPGEPALADPGVADWASREQGVEAMAVPEGSIDELAPPATPSGQNAASEVGDLTSPPISDEPLVHADDVAPPDKNAASALPEIVTEPITAPTLAARAFDGASHGSRQAALLMAEPEAPDAEAHPDSPPFDIRCFGAFQVMAQGREVDGWTIQKARELLAYLVARGGTRVSREEAADALWPEEPADRVGHLLSNAAYYVRRTLKEATPSPNGRFLAVKEQRYQLQPGIFRVDLDAFDAHLRRAETLHGADALSEYDRALAIYRGDFLGKEPYEWAEPYRRDYQRRFIAAAHEAGRIALDCRDVKKGSSFYQAILDRDPIDEDAARSLMRCHARQGDTNAARKVYKLLRESLRRELEDEKAEPLPETTGLFRELTGAMSSSV